VEEEDIVRAEEVEAIGVFGSEPFSGYNLLSYERLCSPLGSSSFPLFWCQKVAYVIDMFLLFLKFH